VPLMPVLLAPLVVIAIALSLSQPPSAASGHRHGRSLWPMPTTFSEEADK
jgi:hypothetical protein